MKKFNPHEERYDVALKSIWHLYQQDRLKMLLSLELPTELRNRLLTSAHSDLRAFDRRHVVEKLGIKQLHKLIRMHPWLLDLALIIVGAYQLECWYSRCKHYRLEVEDAEPE